MQLTRGADYAIRVMVHLATLPEEARALLPDLAKAADAPKSFLSKVLQTLSHAGMLSSQRGQAGGFALLPRGRQASMREVIEAIDGPIYLNVCMMSGNSCNRKAWCPAHPSWVKAQSVMLDVLETTIIAEMAAQITASGAPASGAVPQPSELSVIGK